ncbi:MAG: osmotically inducible protein C [Gammaproteobacteria bacterium SG8_30]|nr:MAG: osmotically inducible protein C [Gammaproteobacteria bacterium SG8_30]
MARLKLEFANADGQRLAGLLETPPEGTTIARYALFAHCFTCGKDIAAASRISRALAARGIAVLRFDFTGLGNSDGDFANTSFSSNVQDLVSAAAALTREYRAPELLVGHSLGGAAVLAAASQLPEVKAVATIGAPATADHLRHLFAGEVDEIGRRGASTVRIGLREFTVKRQFLEDLRAHGSADHIRRLRKALVVFHSPVDDVVPIEEAARIYEAALHPKSFISLDKADHLLSRTEDAEYVAATLAAWASRYLGLEQEPARDRYGERPEVGPREVVVTELDRKFLRGLYSEHHRWMADEPQSYGGTNLGPTPYDLLLMALGACTSMTVRLYARHQKLALDDVTVRMRHKRIHEEDCEDCGDEGRKLERIDLELDLAGDLSEAERARLVEIAGRCPVNRTLTGELSIVKRLRGAA